MAATPKPVRKVSKLIEKSNRKDTAIVLKNAPKQMKKKHAQSSGKLHRDLDKMDKSRKLERSEAHANMKAHGG
jgi:hypothetical protein